MGKLVAATQQTALFPAGGRGARGHGGAGCQRSTRVWEHQMLAVAASHWGRNTVAPWGPGIHDVTGDNSAECMEVCMCM
ncbi:unnamed protein product [Boreogadus saida]